MVPLKNTASLLRKHRLLTYARSAHKCSSFQSSHFVQLLHFKVRFRTSHFNVTCSETEVSEQVYCIRTAVFAKLAVTEFCKERPHKKTAPKAEFYPVLRALGFRRGTEAGDKPNYQLANRFHFFLGEAGRLHYLFYGITELF